MDKQIQAIENLEDDKNRNRKKKMKFKPRSINLGKITFIKKIFQ